MFHQKWCRICEPLLEFIDIAGVILVIQKQSPNALDDRITLFHITPNFQECGVAQLALICLKHSMIHYISH